MSRLHVRREKCWRAENGEKRDVVFYPPYPAFMPARVVHLQLRAVSGGYNELVRPETPIFGGRDGLAASQASRPCTYVEDRRIRLFVGGRCGAPY